MSEQWREMTLGNLIDIKHGFAFKGDSIQEEPKGDVLLTPGNFAISGGFKSDKFKYYDGPIPEEFVLQEGDLIVTMTDLSKQSDTLGFPALVPTRREGRRFLHNQRLGKVIPKADVEVSIGYLYYLMCSREYRHEVLASATGTTVKHTSPDRIRQFRFQLPPLSEQRAIAHVLGTLDDKIELNHRMNETLEEMARVLFKSWFVDFEPVRAKMEGRWRRGESLPGLPAELYDLFPERLAPSELGDIPEGWEVRRLGEVAKVSSGKRPGQRFPVTSDGAKVPLWGGNGPMAFVTEPLVEVPIILTGRVGTLGSIFRITSACWPSDNTLIVVPESSQFFDCLLFQMEMIDYDSLNRGSTQPLLTQGDLKTQLLIMPPEEVVTSFHGFTNRLFEDIENRNRESLTLAAQRDALLPGLVSGEVRVGGLVQGEK